MVGSVLLCACSLGTSVVGEAPPVPDASTGNVAVINEDDVRVFHAPDAIPVRNADVFCGGTAMSLTRRRVTAVLVIDRSGSMQQAGTDGTPKWTALLSTLRTVLPRIETQVSLGMMSFPDAPPADAGMPRGDSCGVSTHLAIEPARLTAVPILNDLGLTSPNGNTPTYEALRVVERYFRAAPDQDSERYVILATDGAPNCIPLPPGCRCMGGTSMMCGPPMQFSTNGCLDADRTVGMIQVLRGEGVGTYVLGLNGVESEGAVLDAMADAGGHARAASPRYYSAASSDDLAREFATVTTSILECRFALDGPPPDPSLVDVRLDGTRLVFDVQRSDGWNWTDDTHREIRFYGRTCDLVRDSNGGSRLIAAFGCPALVPP